MKLTVLALASITSLTLACATSPAARTTTSAPMPAVAPAGNVTGSANARTAVLAFLDAAKSQDLQALSAVWGSVEGSVRDRGNIPRDELEKRELIMMCYLTHDTHQILSDAPAANNERVVSAQLRHGTLARTANFYAVADASGQWYVRGFDMEALTDLCKAKAR